MRELTPGIKIYKSSDEIQAHVTLKGRFDSEGNLNLRFGLDLIKTDILSYNIFYFEQAFTFGIRIDGATKLKNASFLLVGECGEVRMHKIINASNKNDSSMTFHIPLEREFMKSITDTKPFYVSVGCQFERIY